MPESLKIAGPMLALGVLSCIALAGWSATPTYEARVLRVLAGTPLVDGHNDLPWEIRERYKGDVAAINLAADTRHLPVEAGQAAIMTDIPRLRAGLVGAKELGRRDAAFDR